MTPSRAVTGALAVAAILIVGAASIVVVDRYQSDRGDALSPDGPSADATSETLPKLPRTNVQTETIGAFTYELPQALSADLGPPASRAPAFELRSSEGTEIAVRLRDAFGLTGELEVDANGVIVADRFSDRVLRVVFAPGNPWSMYRGDPACLLTAEAGVAPDGRIFCTTDSGQSEGARFLAPRTVTEEQAGSIARDVMSRLGLEVRNIIVSDHGDAGWGMGGGAWGIVVETAVAGLPVIGLDFRLSVAEAGRVVWGFGMVPEPAMVGEYPLIDVATAHGRLIESFRDAEAGSQVGSRLGGGHDPTPATIVGVRLALALSEPPVKAGAQREVSYLVPTLVLDASDGAVFPVPAVTAEYLAD